MLQNFLKYTIILFGILWQGCSRQQEIYNNEAHIRQGLPNFIAKLKNDTSVTIVYFGGSITEEKGWRVQSTQWLQERYPAIKINSVNASIGGTNSKFGAYRFDCDVKPHEPDLLFVEFAVNDSGTDSATVVECMEAIVRKAKKMRQKTDICFIYTVKAEKIDSVYPDNLFKTVQAMEVLARHYAIPSINFGYEIAQQINNNALLMAGSKPYIDSIPVFTKDNVHPYIETGHQIYTEVFKRSFIELENKTKTNRKPLPDPISENSFENATMLPIDSGNVVGDWYPISPDNTDFHKWFGDKIPGTLMTTTAGDQLTFNFTGTTFGITDVIGPKSGYLLLEIDGEVYDTIKRFDPYCFFYRRNFFVIDSLSDNTHTVSLKLLDTPIDKYVILNSKKKFESDPKLFNGAEWYVTAIMVK